jgi:hypothetical protein
MWTTIRRLLDMDEKEIKIDCDLLAWIKDNAGRSKECQIVLTIQDGKIRRATSFMSNTLHDEKY